MTEKRQVGRPRCASSTPLPHATRTVQFKGASHRGSAQGICNPDILFHRALQQRPGVRNPKPTGALLRLCVTGACRDIVHRTAANFRRIWVYANHGVLRQLFRSAN